jgi:hypothetical protein
VFVRFVEADGFLSFGKKARVNLGPGLTVVTGPNGAGKSNLGRCLDLARAVVATTGSDPLGERLDLYADAGYEGVGDFVVRLGMDLDGEWERALVWQFVCACFATSGVGSAAPEQLEEMASNGLERNSLAPLLSGTLTVIHNARAARPWRAVWEFTHAGGAWHAVVAGDDGMYQLRPGRAERTPRGGDKNFGRWMWRAAEGGDDNFQHPRFGPLPDPDFGPFPGLDFGAALDQNANPVDFSVDTSPGGEGETLESVIVLSSMLGIDPAVGIFGFGGVMSAVLRREVVLTDNRRVPLERRFGLEDLGRELDLRDGAAVGAELFRLRNGYPSEQGRFAEIQATFRVLTGRELGLRARSDGSAMIIEPTVTGRHGERLVELSGAGVQEALVLSVLLRDRSDQLTVLDEPAVNLEPTVQRRLMGRLRGPGQFLVITHSADLVPFDDLGDLGRIVRASQGRSGSEIRQPNFGELAKGDLLRQLRLLEPADTRALLFAAGVILCEGSTEVGALPRWWVGAPGMLGLPDPTAANIAVISVDGDAGFGAYLRYLEAFGVPWAVVADGPALRPGSQLADDLRGLGCWPDKQPRDSEGFARWREFWEDAGVFTLADQFGDDGGKGGEFEAFLSRADSRLFAEAKRVAGRSKPRAGAYFALGCPAPPEVMDVYARIAGRLRLGDARVDDMADDRDTLLP